MDKNVYLGIGGGRYLVEFYKGHVKVMYLYESARVHEPRFSSLVEASRFLREGRVELHV